MNSQHEIMYNIPSLLIALILFSLIMIANEAGFRIGRHNQRKANDEIKSQTNAIQAGILGLLALLLGFTFNMALQRFDNRSVALIDESNAIGTALLRTNLLPAPYDSISYALLQEYVNARIEVSKIDLTKEKDRREINKRSQDLQNLLWENASLAAEIDPRPVTTGYFITSLNDVIDSYGKRNAILQRHVPEVILFLLFIVFVTSGALMGYSSGLGLRRTTIPTSMMTFLIVLVVFIIIDLDRPKRGIIKVKQDSLVELKSE